MGHFLCNLLLELGLGEHLFIEELSRGCLGEVRQDDAFNFGFRGKHEVYECLLTST
jgi:hypothetical protein